MYSKTVDESDLLMSIAELAEKVEVMAETLRVWERRYGFPNPSRDASGNRQYSGEHLVQLRLIKSLLVLGYRPGNVVRLGMDELMSLSDKASAVHAPIPDSHQESLQLCVDLIKGQDAARLRRLLKDQLLRVGLRNFVVDLGAPLTSIVRAGCKGSRFTVGETYVLMTVLEPLMREAIKSAAATERRDGPTVLLLTPPQDRSPVELLFVQALFTLEGAVCVPFGMMTSVSEVVARARLDMVDLTVMCCSHKISPRSIIENSRRLQAELGTKLLVSIGHSDDASVRRRVGDERMLELRYVAETVAAWRDAGAGTSSPKSGRP